MNKKTFFSMLVIVIMGALCIWAFVFSKSLMGDANISHNESQGDEQININELVITETKDAEKFWEVYADSAQYNNGNNIAVLKNIVGNFYKEGKVIMSVTSPTAEYNSNTKEVKLMGRVEAANDKNIKLLANQIIWTGSKNEITAQGNVKIIKQDDGIMSVSDKCIFDTDFTNIKLSGNANTYVYPSNHGNL